MAPRTPPPRAPVSGPTPNYWARRAGALVVVLVVAYAIVRAIGSIAGGDDEVATADPGNSTAVAESDGADTDSGTSLDERSDGEPIAAQTDLDCSDEANSALCDELGLDDGVTVEEAADLDGDGDGDVETSADDEDAPAGDEPTQTGPPTSANPAKVYIVGDSDAGTFGPYLETLLAGTLVTTTELNYKVSSGLARPDFFNWPLELEQKLPEVDPDIVVVTFGGNDSQGLSLPQDELEFVIGDPLDNEAEWTEEYQRRAGAVMDLLLEDDRHVIWVGIPNDDNPDVTAKLAIQDRAVKAAAAERPDVVFVDTWTRFSGRDGGWAEFVIDPRDNTGKDVRADDGFHLNQNGAEILAIDIAIEVQKELREMGAAL
ncbi:MAG: GDSL-type esterase/lipase family protein [Ilumatobacter sp.]|uniref:SGNH/GDSL hydrolase family protein n=1 Tax=Ilumatobacter sp. TaxID=1967498 RepID=UPI00329990C0